MAKDAVSSPRLASWQREKYGYPGSNYTHLEYELFYANESYFIISGN